ncbi:hypothetical protein DDZ16_19415 [Marinilabilia rubra]|uniref:Uncharacterized protein n=1 Tax=Marinilabilia rubra TaxID=2162893 RepID=A0A2U2B3V2_9BACT|nr:hypothetical protein DDZ16_19415 [Marinilabilia rubra]
MNLHNNELVTLLGILIMIIPNLIVLAFIFILYKKRKEADEKQNQILNRLESISNQINSIINS